jgi:hypothetical protein
MLDFYASGFWQLAMCVAGVVLLGAALAYAVFKGAGSLRRSEKRKLDEATIARQASEDPQK